MQYFDYVINSLQIKHPQPIPYSLSKTGKYIDPDRVDSSNKNSGPADKYLPDDL